MDNWLVYWYKERVIEYRWDMKIHDVCISYIHFIVHCVLQSRDFAHILCTFLLIRCTHPHNVPNYIHCSLFLSKMQLHNIQHKEDVLTWRTTESLEVENPSTPAAMAALAITSWLNFMINFYFVYILIKGRQRSPC